MISAASVRTICTGSPVSESRFNTINKQSLPFIVLV